LIFTTNLVWNHLDKNAKNIGTLKAFGLSNRKIAMIYSAISCAFISVAFVFCYSVTMLIGIYGSIYLRETMGIVYVSFAQVDWWILVLTLVIIPTVLVFLNLRRKLNSKTPGNLIYGRG
jgi:ABC-type cobalamin transport system permease subunit